MKKELGLEDEWWMKTKWQVARGVSVQGYERERDNSMWSDQPNGMIPTGSSMAAPSSVGSDGCEK